MAQKKTKAALEAELETSEKKTEELQGEVDQLKSTIQELQKRLERKDEEIERKEKEIDNKDEEIYRNEEKIEELRGCLNDALDKGTAEFLMGQFSSIVEKVAEKIVNKNC